MALGPASRWRTWMQRLVTSRGTEALGNLSLYKRHRMQRHAGVRGCNVTLPPVGPKLLATYRSISGIGSTLSLPTEDDPYLPYPPSLYAIGSNISLPSEDVSFRYPLPPYTPLGPTSPCLPGVVHEGKSKLYLRTWVQHHAGYRGRKNFRQYLPPYTYVGAASRCLGGLRNFVNVHQILLLSRLLSH